MKGLNSFIAFLGLAIWWLLLFSSWMGWLTLFPIIAATLVLVVVSLVFRSHPQIVSIWTPAFTFVGLFTLAAVLDVLIALLVFVGFHPQSLYGALTAPVFVFMAIPIAVIGIATAVIFFLLYRYRPKSFPQPLISLATLNTLALCVFIAIYHQTLFIFARDPMIVHVLDSQDRPVSLVTIQYANYTTKADGGTETEPEESGTLITDDKGTARLSPDYLARKVVLALSKDGYRKIIATLVNDDVGMGDQGHRDINVHLDGRREDVIRTSVSNKHPIEFKLYIATDKEAPSPEKQINFRGVWPSSGEIYLHLTDGTLTESPDGDLKFEILEQGAPDNPHKHFKITALNGASLTPYHISGECIRIESIKFDDMMSLAPLNKFTDNLMIDRLNEFYYRSQDGKQYARIEVFDLGGYRSPYKRGPQGQIFLWTMGSR